MNDKLDEKVIKMYSLLGGQRPEMLKRAQKWLGIVMMTTGIAMLVALGFRYGWHWYLVVAWTAGITFANGRNKVEMKQ